MSSVIRINGTYTFTTALKKGMILDVSGNGTVNGTNIQIYEANGTKAQIFVVTHLGNGWHKIINQSSSKSIDVAGGKKASGVNVQLYDYNGTDAQMWKFIQDPSGGYYIQNKLGYYLDVSGGKTSNETNVQVYNGNQTASQRWLLNKASDTTQSNIITSSYAKTKSNVITYSKNKSGSEKITTNFQIKEFACQDGSDTILIDAKLAALLQDIRNHFGKPVVITSAYRTKTHNKNVGGASNSYYLYGKAADIYISGVSPKEIAKYAESLGVKGIGLYESFVHVDTRTTKYYWNEDGRQVSTFR